MRFAEKKTTRPNGLGTAVPGIEGEFIAMALPSEVSRMLGSTIVVDGRLPWADFATRRR